MTGFEIFFGVLSWPIYGGDGIFLEKEVNSLNLNRPMAKDREETMEQERFEKYEIERKEFMESREFGQILTAFEGEDECPIVDFIEELADEFRGEGLQEEIKYLEKITEGNERNLHLEDVLNDYGGSIRDIAFEIGFVFREMFQIGENQKSVKGSIELIKARIIGKGFLPPFGLAEKPSTPADTVITQKDCDLCRFWATCVGAATFRAFLDLEALTFGDVGCPRDWEALKDLVQYSVLPNRQSPTL